MKDIHGEIIKFPSKILRYSQLHFEVKSKQAFSLELNANNWNI